MWIEKALPPRNVIQQDLESRNVDFSKWSELSNADQRVTTKLLECYAQHNHGRKFDEQLHQFGVKLRLDQYCKWVLQEYPRLQR